MLTNKSSVAYYEATNLFQFMKRVVHLSDHNRTIIDPATITYLADGYICEDGFFIELGIAGIGKKTLNYETWTGDHETNKIKREKARKEIEELRTLIK